MKAKTTLAFLEVVSFVLLGCVQQQSTESAQPADELVGGRSSNETVGNQPSNETVGNQPSNETVGGELMKLLSNDLKQGEAIPSEFTCDGNDISPELHWSNAPANTKSFALTVRDPDAPRGTFDHWLVCNIPASISSIPQGAVPQGAVQVRNDFGKLDYGGPCPPSGTHRYFFKVYALDVEKIECRNKQELFQQIEAHKIAEAELLAPYQRK